jgi:pilus assembly protein FimV
VRTISVAILAGILGLAGPFAAQAAGLGRLTVLSPLGSPLNAEIEIVSLQSGEEDGLSARLASADAYRQAGIEPSSALRTVRFAIVKRDGRPVLRVTSTAPVNEPFVDLLVDLEWTGGRLTREYTVLLDPPEIKGPQTIAAAPQAPVAPIAQPLPPLEAKPKPQAAAPAQDSGAPVQDSEAPAQDSGAPVQDVAASAQGQGAPVQDVAASAQSQGAPVQNAPAKPGLLAGANTYDVKRGDTLGAIARANLPPGVSLNQMMIAIYRANPDAFLRENINLVRAGRTLTLPSAEELNSVDAAEANRLVQSHRAEWEDYRSRLAAAPTRAETASGRAVSGKIEGKPEASAPGATEDQVRLSKADPAKPGAADRAARADDAAARERALQEAQSRVTDLEKNVADLQKLLELKNQQLAELEKKSGAKPAAKAEPAKPEAKAEPAKPAAPVVAQAPAAAPGAAAPAQAAAQPEAKKAEPSPEAKKAEPAKPRPKAAPPPPPPPSLLDEFLDNTVALAGLGAVVVLLLGYALWSWRRKKATQAKFSDSVLGGAGPSLGDSRSPASASQASVSQTSGMEAEEVDPIAEADVYMAYGRDAQAEEILKEALQKDQSRVPVHAKLLEIYAKRNDTRAFEQSALRLKTLTNGSGADWDKAAALGRSIDPGNGLYGGGSSAAAVAAAPAAAAFAAAAAAAPSIDFDIGGGTTPGMVTTDIPIDDQPKAAAPSTIDFDLGAGSTPNSAKVPDPDATLAAIDFNLDAEPTKKPAAAPAPAPAAVDSAATASGLDFDLNLDLGDQSAAATKSVPSMDLSSISLDLGSAGEPGGSTSSNDPKWQEVATKLDLAKAYEEMGDKDGARELLGEVMKDGDATQKGQAQQLLSKLG